MNPDRILDLHWKLTNTYHTTNIGHSGLQVSNVTTHCVDVDSISQAGGNRYGNWCGTTLNTDTITLQSNIKPIICSITSDGIK